MVEKTVFNYCKCGIPSDFKVTNEKEDMKEFTKVDWGIFKYYREEACFMCHDIVCFTKAYSNNELMQIGIQTIQSQMRENYSIQVTT